MRKCTDSCRIRIDSRTGESECFHHGTVEFVRQPYDAMDDSEFLEIEKFKYTDKFLYNAVRQGSLLMDELAAQLNVHEGTIMRAVRRHEKKLLESIA